MYELLQQQLNMLHLMLALVIPHVLQCKNNTHTHTQTTLLHAIVLKFVMQQKEKKYVEFHANICTFPTVEGTRWEQI